MWTIDCQVMLLAKLQQHQHPHSNCFEFDWDPEPQGLITRSYSLAKWYGPRMSEVYKQNSVTVLCNSTTLMGLIIGCPCS